MLTTNCRVPAEEVLVNLVHDLRQPLGTIETSAYVLNLLLHDAQDSAQEQLRAIERQVDAAARLLNEACAELHRLRSQRTEAESLDFTKSATATVT